MTVADYITRRYGSNRNRHWWGIAHRARLIDSGGYVKTSQQTRYRFTWSGGTTVGTIQESVNDMIAAMGLSGRIYGPVMAEEVRKAGGIERLLGGYMPAVSLACLSTHSLCEGRTYTHTHGWIHCQCSCHKEN